MPADDIRLTGLVPQRLVEAFTAPWPVTLSELGNACGATSILPQQVMVAFTPPWPMPSLLFGKTDGVPSIMPVLLNPLFPPRFPIGAMTCDGSDYIPPILDFMYRGAGHIAGTVTHDGSVASRNVYLFHRETGALVARTTSAADGTYRFDRLSTAETFLVVATDADVDEFNAACADVIVPVT